MNKKKLNVLEQYVHDKTKLGYRPVDIRNTLESMGLKVVSLARVVQIQQELGLKDRQKEVGRPSN